MTEAVCQEWAKTQIRLLINQQHNGFKIKAINSLDFEYPETNFPPDNLWKLNQKKIINIIFMFFGETPIGLSAQEKIRLSKIADELDLL